MARGHRLRLAVSTAYWPLIWPAPEPVTLELSLHGCSLALPHPPPGAAEPEPFEPPASSPALAETALRDDHHERTVTVDLATGEQVLRIVDDFGARRIDALGLETDTVARETYRIAADAPQSARCRTHWTEVLARDGWRARTESVIEQSVDAEYFYVDAELEAFENEEKVFSRRWRERIRRDLL